MSRAAVGDEPTPLDRLQEEREELLASIASKQAKGKAQKAAIAKAADEAEARLRDAT